jgi:murein DD-endopeptidase MepM/ murein hydrolase activator NlpD
LANKKKTFYQWLSTKVSLTIRNEENYALKTNIRLSYAQVLVYGSISFFLFSILTLWMATKVVGIWYNPREDYFNTKKKVITLALAVDSLQEQIRQKDTFIGHIKSIVETGEVTEKSPASTEDSKELDILSQKVDLDFMSPIDSSIRNEFETDQPLSTSKNTPSANLYSIILISPIHGIVTENYDERKKHYGVDIVSEKDEPVKAVADGRVILSSWTDDTGYVIGIQHQNDLVSFYKHNSYLHKNVGETVKIGEIVATIGNTGELTTGPHLHFELWHNGQPVNPKELISF